MEYNNGIWVNKLFIKGNKLIIRQMETEISVFGNMLDDFDGKVKEVALMRNLINQELKELQGFYSIKDSVLERLHHLQHSLHTLSGQNNKQTFARLLSSYQSYQLEVVGKVVEKYECVIGEMRKEFDRSMCEKENELQKNYLIIRGLKGEKSMQGVRYKTDGDQELVSKTKQTKSKGRFEKENIKEKKEIVRFITKDKSREDFKESTKKQTNINSVRSVFKLQRLSLDMNSKSQQKLSRTPFTFIKTTFPSPEPQQCSMEKQDFLDISQSSAKRQNQSLFEELNIKSKRKQFIESVPFEAEVSIVEQNFENENNVFAKLTFGKDKAQYLKQDSGKREGSQYKSQIVQKFLKNKSSATKKQDQEGTHIDKNKDRERLKSKDVIESKRSSISFEGNKKQENKDSNAEHKRAQQLKYIEYAKKHFVKESLGRKKQNPSFYVGDPNKETKYEGLKRDGRKFGNGVSNYSDGLIYDGGFSNNYRQGFGTLFYDHVQIYSGDWERDMIHGQGKLKNCNVIKSNNSRLKVNGGVSIFSGWISYMGRFVENTFDGPGELELPQGERFIGEFVNGVVQGEGTYYKNDGDVRFGIWKNNQLIQEI